MIEKRPSPSSRHIRLVDWLGARKPLDLIAGACAVIALVQFLAHAVST